MIRKGLFFFVLLIGFTVVAQKPQRIGYIDMEYILENVPEYTEAQSRLNTKVIAWQQKLDGIKREIEVLKTDLSNEKPLLTNELISEREEDILIKMEDLRKLQAAYFGPKGNLFLLRKQLVKPVQDQVYNAVQKIAVRKKYDIVLDKSSDLILLYANKKYDISEQVLNSIVKGRKKVELEAKRNKKKEELSDKQQATQDKIKQKAVKQEELKAQKAAKDELRAQRIKEKQERNDKRREELKNKNTQKTDTKKEVQVENNDATTTKKEIEKEAKETAKEAKRAALLERIKKQNEQKAKKKEELVKAKEEKRKKRIEELEKRKKEKSKEKEDNN